MICLSPTCENYQKDLGLAKFCLECGQKAASPELQSLTCPALGCSNQGKDLGRMKFCSECGTTTVAGVSAAQKSTALGFAPRASTEGMQLPPVQLPSGYAAYQGGGAGSGGSGRSIIAGDQNITHSTVVHNQDQTKQVRQCAVSGRQAEVTRGHVCPACGLWVHEDYYDRTLMRCDDCSTAQAKRSTGQFKGKVQQFLTDGVITKEELSELRSMGGNLGLSLPEQDTIISQLKQEMLSSNSAQRPMTLIDQSRWKAVLRAVENKVFNTDPVAGRVHLDSLRALHKSYPDNEAIACLLVSILSGEMFDDPLKTLPEIERVLNALCFAHDTPRKYLTRAVFYRGSTLLGQAKAPHSDGQGNWADMLEQYNEASREAASALESMFPNSEECHALQVAMMIDSYLVSGDESIREDVNLLLEGAASAAGDSDVGLAIKAAHANAIEGFGWGDDREMTIGQGLARGYFSDLFSLNLPTLRKMIEGVDEKDSEFDDEDCDFEMEEEAKKTTRDIIKQALVDNLQIDELVVCNEYNRYVVDYLDQNGQNSRREIVAESFDDASRRFTSIGLNPLQIIQEDSKILAAREALISQALTFVGNQIERQDLLLFCDESTSGWWNDKLHRAWMVTDDSIIAVDDDDGVESFNFENITKITDGCDRTDEGSLICPFCAEISWIDKNICSDDVRKFLRSICPSIQDEQNSRDGNNTQDFSSMTADTKIVETEARKEIRVAVEYVIEHAGCNCATIYAVNKGTVQIMDCNINCSYPHKDSPEILYPEIINHPIVAQLESFEKYQHMTVNLNGMNQSEIVLWIEQYFVKVLSVDLTRSKISHYTEDLS